jgi:hypothetical protein
MPRDIETICLKCLQKEPARRYLDVLALAEDLRRFQAGEPIEARPVSGPERLWRWCRRNQRVAALLATVAGLLVIVAVGSLVSAGIVKRKNLQLDQKNQALSEANVQLGVAKDQAEREREEAT